MHSMKFVILFLQRWVPEPKQKLLCLREQDHLSDGAIWLSSKQLSDDYGSKFRTLTYHVELQMT